MTLHDPRDSDIEEEAVDLKDTRIVQTSTGVFFELVAICLRCAGKDQIDGGIIHFFNVCLERCGEEYNAAANDSGASALGRTACAGWADGVSSMDQLIEIGEAVGEFVT